MKTAILLALSASLIGVVAGDRSTDSSWPASASVSAPPAPSDTAPAHPDGGQGGQGEGHVSITSYDAPWSSGESTWTVPTTVSYMTGANYTSMLPPASSAKSSASGSASAWASGTEGPHSASEAPAAATGSQGAEPYKGAAAQEVGMGVGVLVMAALAHIVL